MAFLPVYMNVSIFLSISASMSTSTIPARREGEAASLLVNKVRKYSEQAANTLLCAFSRIVPTNRTRNNVDFCSVNQVYLNTGPLCRNA